MLQQLDFHAQALASDIWQNIYVKSCSTSNVASILSAAAGAPFGGTATAESMDFTSAASVMVYDLATEKRFMALMEEWRSKKNPLASSARELAMLGSYQQIIGLGLASVPFILRELKKELGNEPDDWFWALASITGANPIRPEHRGDVCQMAIDWLRWGLERGYVSGEGLGAVIS
jgi:hypothetical protein